MFGNNSYVTAVIADVIRQVQLIIQLFMLVMISG